jgi:hypothetical protein
MGERMRALVLTYHSHNISGSDYATNDHVALASDLRTVHTAGGRFVPLATIASSLRAGLEGADELLVGLSFDDGPRFDYADFVHPLLGEQRGFLNILRDFRDEMGASAQPDLHATSFVIASPEARRAMERAPDCGYPDMPDWLGEDWWSEAIDSGLMAIGNHSWDHVHHAVERIAASTPQRDDFTRVASYTDADREIRAAAAYINARVQGRCTHFAFPFGHVNDFLVKDYLPLRGYEHGMVAAFGTGGRAVRADDSVWNIPRLVCGEHWRSPGELEKLLLAAA